MVTISLVGQVTVHASDGQDLTPRGKKTRGLIALLASSKDFKRSRVWIQDKLWSDRGPEQAAGSMRQAVADLRRALGPHKDALISHAGWVQFDPEQVSLATDENVRPDQEFCEDLDIRDPEFESWVRDVRQSKVSGGVEARPEQPILMIVSEGSDSDQSRNTLKFVRDDVVHSLLELGDYSIVDLDSQQIKRPSTPAPGVFLRINSINVGEKQSVSISLETLSASWVLWQSPIVECDTQSDDQAVWRLRSLSQTCVARIQHAIEEQAERMSAGQFATCLASRALRLLFSFSKSDLMQADALLRSAYEIHPKGVYLSWRAFLRNTAVFEHLTDSFLEPLDHHELHAQAIMDDPLNSYALLFAGQQSFVKDNDPKLGQMLCDKALEINPSNPMGWAFKSNVLTLLGQDSLSIEAARRGRILSEGLPCRPSLLLHACIAETASGRYEQALMLGKYSQISKSNCQAVNRFMFVINHALERPEEAQKQLRRIRLREPDFKRADLLRSDYPTWTLQRMAIANSI
jgi:tetratricopeptide (TPR) repeat protein